MWSSEFAHGLPLARTDLAHDSICLSHMSNSHIQLPIIFYDTSFARTSYAIPLNYRNAQSMARLLLKSSQKNTSTQVTQKVYLAISCCYRFFAKNDFVQLSSIAHLLTTHGKPESQNANVVWYLSTKPALVKTRLALIDGESVLRSSSSPKTTTNANSLVLRTRSHYVSPPSSLEEDRSEGTVMSGLSKCIGMAQKIVKITHEV